MIRDSIEEERFGKVVGILFMIAFINFFAFVIAALCIGGDAFSGHQAGGRYFLASHGKLTETSRTVFMYSKIHVISVFITHPLAILSAWVSHLRKKIQGQI